MQNNKKSGLSALVVEGGGMRGIFTAGVLDSFGRCGFDPFGLYIGVSAGACNLASHLAGQYGRNFRINTTYSLDRRFINPLRFIRGGHFIDLDWLWDITIRECRLDRAAIFKTLKRKNAQYLVVATSADTGRALYLEPDEFTLEHYLKVSSSLPLLYRTLLETGDGRASDGGIADSIPVIEAYRRGATDITVLRTRPGNYVKHDRFSVGPLGFVLRKYPNLADSVRKRAERYMEAVDFIRKPPAGVQVTEIAPSGKIRAGRTTRDIRKLEELYREGEIAGKRHVLGKAELSL
ncbi:MAG TPA: patatin family protein [Spirochaetota bacterium]|nr:patatin family protein [Spirochaetota bacterium]HRZ27940.1 patatin family protein [Spirochaetota bacterium]HSA13571.1 patatin family protein [Spirochaetota bacterium]